MSPGGLQSRTRQFDPDGSATRCCGGVGRCHWEGGLQEEEGVRMVRVLFVNEKRILGWSTQVVGDALREMGVVVAVVSQSAQPE